MKPEPERVARHPVLTGDSVRIIHLTLAPGQRLPPHRHPGREVILQALEGSVTLHLDEVGLELVAGQRTHLSGEVLLEPANDGKLPAAVLVTPVAGRPETG